MIGTKNIPLSCERRSIYSRIEKEWVPYPFVSIGAHGATGTGIRGHFIAFPEADTAEIGPGKRELT
jgi:hypothetical protein